jgi:DNA-binding MarR family transcriptional regulator
MSGALRKVDAPRAAALSHDEISAFCNAVGLAPRCLAQAREEVTAMYALGPRGAWILGLIERGVTSPTALARVLGIGRSLLTAETARLVDAGLVLASQSAQDGRRVDFSLTRQGSEANDRLRKAIAGFVNERLAGYSRDQVLACIALLQDFTGMTEMGESGK